MKTWDELVEDRKVISKLAYQLDVSENYLIYQTNFLKAVTLNNKYLATRAINNAKQRLKEIKLTGL